MKVVSTFAGMGGSTLGYKMAGCDVVAAVEWDDHAVACYRANNPTSHVVHKDIAQVTAKEILKATGLEVGELDILDGSPPCQGFSTLGKRHLEDPRNSLFKEHIRLIEGLKPKCIVIENVKGMVLGKMRRVAAEIIREVQNLGYKTVMGLMTSDKFGVPQKRQRVFLIGSRIGTPSLPRPTGSGSVAGAALANVKSTFIPEITMASLRWAAPLMRPGEKGSQFLERTAPHRLRVDGDGKRIGKWFSMFKLDPRKVAPTVVKNCGRRWIHWENRPLSVEEYMVLQGIPDSYTFVALDGWNKQKTWEESTFRIGNSVPPPMTRAIAEQVLIPLCDGG